MSKREKIAELFLKLRRYPLHIRTTFSLGAGFIRITVHVFVEPIGLSVPINAARLTSAPNFGHIADLAFFIGSAHCRRRQRFTNAFERNERRALEIADIRALLFFGAQIATRLLGPER